MSVQHRPRHLLKTPSSKVASKDLLLDFLHSRSATTLHKASHQTTEVPRTHDAFDAYLHPKVSKKVEPKASKKRRSGSSQVDVNTLLLENMQLKADLTRMQTIGMTGSFDDEKEQALDQVQEKLLATIGQVSELKHDLKSYDRFFAELYEFLAASEANDLVKVGLSKMRHFYKAKKASASSEHGTPDRKHFDFKRQLSMHKSVKDRPSPRVTSKTSRNLGKVGKLLSPQTKSAQTPSLRMFASSANSRSSTPLEHLESTADKLEFILLKTQAVLKAWGQTKKP
jgi:hypothetical protein